MGIGGNLMWTAVFREFWEKNNNGNNDFKIIPKKTNGNVFRDFLWSNNPYITFNPKYKYLKKIILEDSTLISTHKNYDKYRDNEHIIISRCKNYGIENPKLKCELYFGKAEEDRVQKILKTLPKNFICIEPNSKNIFTKNKFYPFEKFQKIVNHYNEFNFVQVGITNRILDNVTSVVGKLTFRETCLLLKYSEGYIGIEGGLVHGCNAVSCKKAFVIVPPMFHSDLIAYPEYEYVWLGTKDHGRCGMRIKCDKCHDIINNHDENLIIEKLSKFFNN